MKHLKTFENIQPEKILTYYSNDKVKSIVYKLNGKKHREDGPAYQEWFLNGEKDYEMYFVNGDRHRADGPAVIFYNENGEIGNRLYYLNNIIYKRENWLEELKKMNSPYYKEQKYLYDIEKNIEKYNI